MELIEGITLNELVLKAGRIHDSLVIYILAKVLMAVEYLHSYGFVHRDVKPSNLIMTPRGDVYLVDYGSVLILDTHRHPHACHLDAVQIAIPHSNCRAGIKSAINITSTSTRTRTYSSESQLKSQSGEIVGSVP